MAWRAACMVFFSWEYLDKLDALNAGIIEVSGWWIEIWQWNAMNHVIFFQMASHGEPWRVVVSLDFFPLQVFVTVTPPFGSLWRGFPPKSQSSAMEQDRMLWISMGKVERICIFYFMSISRYSITISCQRIWKAMQKTSPTKIQGRYGYWPI